MEEIKENKSVVTSYRLSPDTKDKLQQQLKDLGMTQEQYFNKVVSTMELESVKKNSFLSKDTTIIQSNLDAILNAFISVADGSNNLINNKEAELQELKINFKDMVVEKESLIKSQKEELGKWYTDYNELQKENEEFSSAKNEYSKELSSIKNEHNKELEHLEGNLKDKNLIVQEYKNKNDMLLTDLAEQQKYKKELLEYKKLLADAQGRDIDKDNKIKDNDYNINQLNENIEKIKQDNKKDLEILKKENTLNIKLAVAEANEKLNEKLGKEQLKHNADIQEYHNKYKLLLDELGKKNIIPKVAKKKKIVAKGETNEKEI